MAGSDSSLKSPPKSRCDPFVTIARMNWSLIAQVHAMRLIIVLLAGIMLSASLTGCSGPTNHSWLSLDPHNWANRSLVDEPVFLDVIGPVAVDVESFGGDVVIRTTTEHNQAKVTVMREGVHGYGRKSEVESSLEHINYTTQIVAGELGQVLQVRTTTTDPEPHFQRAHVFIELPEIDGVTVRTNNGRVWARGVRGKIDITTNEDDVRVMTNQPLNRPITIVNRNGEIDLRMRAESQGRIDAQTVNGRAHGFARYGRLIIDPKTSHDAFHATLNDGRNVIALRTVNANVEVAVVENPESVDVHPFP